MSVIVGSSGVDVPAFCHQVSHCAVSPPRGSELFVYIYTAKFVEHHHYHFILLSKIHSHRRGTNVDDVRRFVGKAPCLREPSSWR